MRLGHGDAAQGVVQPEVHLGHVGPHRRLGHVGPVLGRQALVDTAGLCRCLRRGRRGRPPARRGDKRGLSTEGGASRSGTSRGGTAEASASLTVRRCTWWLAAKPRMPSPSFRLSWRIVRRVHARHSFSLVRRSSATTERRAGLLGVGPLQALRVVPAEPGQGVIPGCRTRRVRVRHERSARKVSVPTAESTFEVELERHNDRNSAVPRDPLDDR